MQTRSLRSSCGFLLVAIDNLGKLNEAYGFDAADEVIAAVAKRIRAQMRGGDQLGRISGNKFGVILKKCTPEDMTVAADRLLAGVREEVVATAAGPIATTVTIGGITAPRHARTVNEILTRVQETLESAKQAARLVPRLSAEHRTRCAAARERRADRRDHCRAQRAPHPPDLRAGGGRAHPQA